MIVKIIKLFSICWWCINQINSKLAGHSRISFIDALQVLLQNLIGLRDGEHGNIQLVYRPVNN